VNGGGIRGGGVVMYIWLSHLVYFKFLQCRVADGIEVILHISQRMPSPVSLRKSRARHYMT